MEMNNIKNRRKILKIFFLILSAQTLTFSEAQSLKLKASVTVRISKLCSFIMFIVFGKPFEMRNNFYSARCRRSQSIPYQNTLQDDRFRALAGNILRPYAADCQTHRIPMRRAPDSGNRNGRRYAE